MIRHGLKHHPLYQVWANMKQRCHNERHIQYPEYGGRSIGVCQEWQNDFLFFYDWAIENGWAEGLEIDRKDNDGNYSPDNCRFVTRRINAVNRGVPNSNVSGYAGVCQSRAKGSWLAYIGHKGKNYHVGSFSTIEQAAWARDFYIISHKFPHKLQKH